MSNLSIARALEPDQKPSEFLDVINSLKEFFCDESDVAYAVDKAEFERHRKWRNLVWYVETPTKFVWIAGVTILAVDALVESVDWVMPLSLHRAAASIGNASSSGWRRLKV